MGMGAPWMPQSKRVIKSIPNPLDKSTIINIYPKDILETNHTLSPGVFPIPAGSYEKPGLLVIGSSSWFKQMDFEQPDLEIPQSSVQVADSVVKDFCNGVLGCDMVERMPGLFFLPGEKSVLEIKKDFKTVLDRVRDKQRSWYLELIQIADTSWARTNGNPLGINEVQRLAAQELGIKEKPWMQDFNTMELVPCPACGNLRNGNFPVCQTCHTIVDKKKYDEMGMKAAS